MTTPSQDILARIAELRARHEDFCIATIVRTAHATSAKAGAKAVVTRDGALHGFIGGGCVQGAVKRVAAEVLAAGRPRLIRVKPKAEVVSLFDTDGVELHKSSCPSGGTVDLFIEPMREPARLIVCGVSPVAAALVRIAAAMGHRTVVAAAEADHAAVPGADRYLDGFGLEALTLTPADAVVVATQGRRDRDALQAALASPVTYVGMVASRRKAAVLKQALAEAGMPAASLDRLKAPAGIDLHAIEPEEIALSVIAEIIERRRSAQLAATISDEMKKSA